MAVLVQDDRPVPVRGGVVDDLEVEPASHRVTAVLALARPCVTDSRNLCQTPIASVEADPARAAVTGSVADGALCNVTACVLLVAATVEALTTRYGRLVLSSLWAGETSRRTWALVASEIVFEPRYEPVLCRT